MQWNKELAGEYLENAKQIEQRITQLETEKAKINSPTMIEKYNRRMLILHTMVNDARETAYILEHYYDDEKQRRDRMQPKPQKKPIKKRGRPKKVRQTT